MRGEYVVQVNIIRLKRLRTVWFVSCYVSVTLALAVLKKLLFRGLIKTS